MFKTLKTLFVQAVVILLLVSANVKAENVSIDMLMSIQTLSIELNPASSDFRNIQLAIGQNEVVRSTIKNTGNGSQDYGIRITSTTGTWQPVSTEPLPNQYRLRAIWHEFNTIFTTNTAQATQEFQDNDIVTEVNQQSSDRVFFNDFETHGIQGVQGTGVLPLEDRNLFIWVQGPPSTGGIVSKAHMGITVTASP